MINNTQPHPKKVPYPILRPKPGYPLRFCSRSRKIFGLDTHYGDKGTFNCPGPEHCNRCKGGDPARYQGYLIGQGMENDLLGICHLTAAAAIELQVHEDTSRGLLGAKILLIREGPASNGPVSAKLFGWDDEVEAIPWGFLSDIVNAIYRVRLGHGKGERSV